MKFDPVVISFYTNDWEYPDHAERLKQECQQHGLKFYIKERESTGDYIQNTAIKPFFIKECIERFRRPVIWIDVDAIILQSFTLDFKGNDMLACKHINSHVNREWAVAFLAFDYTKNSVDFLEKWCLATPRKTDEAAFEDAWQLCKNTVKIGVLPPTYHFVKWSFRIDPPEDTIICHQLSKFEDKLRRKKNGAVDETQE